MTAEIQVRTLMEEVWGEVDHTMNYPYPVESLACREQLKVLARVTSSASRLVDSIFATVAERTYRGSSKKSARVAD
jgi:ppGpp synthetase/RelA/SpoT-type nucleotidyltranferase